MPTSETVERDELQDDKLSSIARRGLVRAQAPSPSQPVDRPRHAPLPAARFLQATGGAFSLFRAGKDGPTLGESEEDVRPTRDVIQEL